MKNILIVIGSLAGIILLALLAGLYYIARFDPNTHKQQITDRFFAATGRQLHLDGDISLTIYPWLGLSVDQLSIANAAGFSKEPLLAVAHAELRLKLLPLMHSEVEIDTVRLSGVRANLQVAADGSNNWTFVTGKDTGGAADATSGGSKLNKLVIGGVDVRDTRVVYDNRATAAHYDVDNLDLAIGELSYGKPLALGASLHVTSRKPELRADLKLTGTALYDVDNGRYQLDPLQIQATLSGPTVPNGSAALTLSTALLFDARKNSLTLPQLELAALDSRIRGQLAITDMRSEQPSFSTELHASSNDVSVFFHVLGQDDLAARIRSLDNKLDVHVSIDANLQRGEVKVPTLQASLLGFTVNGTLTGSKLHDSNGVFTGNLSLANGNLHELMKVIGQPDLAESAQSLSLVATIGGNGKLLQLSPLTLTVALTGKTPQQLQLNANTEVNLDNKSLVINQLTLKGAGLDLSGELSASNLTSKLDYEGNLSLPVTDVRQLMQQLQLPAPLTADATVLQKISAEAAFTGTSNSFALQKFALTLDDSHLSGNSRIDDLATMQGSFMIDIDAINADRYLAPATSAAKDNNGETAKPLPVAQLRKLNLQGAINIGQLGIYGLKLSKITVPLQAGKGVITLNPVAASLYGGSFNGKLALDVAGTTPLAKVSTTLGKIDLGALLQDFMKTNYVAGTGNVELTLEGRGNDSLSLKRNLNGAGKILLDDGVLRGVDVGGTLTMIETMIRSKQLVDLPSGGETRFSNFSATLAIQDGVVNSNDLLIRAPGWQVNGMGTLADLRRNAIDFDLVAMVDPATATVADQKYDIGGHQLPIACKGSLSSPRCLPDAKAILKDAAAKPARELLDKALNRLLR